MAQGTMVSELSKRQNLENVLIQFWEASSKIKGGQRYRELTIKSKEFYILSDDDRGLSLYRTYSFNQSITIPEEVEDYAVQGQRDEGVISRVFRSNTTEMSPNIAYYSVHEYPQKDFALSCGIRTSFCLPLFKTMNYSGTPDGVMELVSTCDQDLEDFRRYCDYYNTLFLQETRMILIDSPKINILEQENLEMQHVLMVLCQAFSIPLAQYWIITHPALGLLSVMYQQSSIKYENSTPWRNFKEACLWMRLNIGEGLVGKTYLSHKSLFCRDITEFNIINHPLAHYAHNCGSTACFTIYLSGFFPQHRECVLVFFLPAQEMDSWYPRTILNSLLATIKEHLQNYMVIYGEECGQVLSVEVINSSTHSEPDSFKLGQPESYVPQQVVEEETIVLDTSTGKMMLQDVLQMHNNEIIVGVERDDTTIPVVHKTRIEAHTSKREKKSVEDISFESLSQHFGKPLDDVAKTFGVSRSTLKRICRVNGIKRWQSGKRRIGVNPSSKFSRKFNNDEPIRRNSSCSCMSPVQDTVVSHTSKDLSKMTVKAMYSGDIIRFRLPDLSGIAELKDNVIKRLHLERNSFSIKYEDDEDEWVSIICDDDVQDCIEISRSSKKAKIKMMLHPLVNCDAS